MKLITKKIHKRISIKNVSIDLPILCIAVLVLIIGIAGCIILNSSHASEHASTTAGLSNNSALTKGLPPDITPTVNGLNVSLNGVCHPASGASVTSIKVTWGDGTKDVASSFPFTHNYLKARIYKVTATCSDSLGNSKYTRVKVEERFFTGKLLSLQAYASDIPNLQKLHANSVRPEISFDTNTGSFVDKDRLGVSTGTWMNQTTTAHIQAIPLLESYIPVTPNSNVYIDPTIWANAVTKWCKQYCYGGSFYKKNTSANEYYAPHILEILNEPYGGWFRGGSVPPIGYANMLIATRTALDNAGLGYIGILGASGDAGHASWTADVAAANGYKSVIGLADHPYANSQTYRVTPISAILKAGFDEVYYYHQLYNIDIYITEVGWCSQSTIDVAKCDLRNETEADKDANITDSINQLGSVSWIKDFNYYNLRDYKQCVVITVGQPCVGQYVSYGLILSTGANEPSYSAYLAAAIANGF